MIMSTLNSLITKETLHIVRDRRTMLVTILMPLMLLLLFGFAISTEVNNVRVAVCTDQFDDEIRNAISRLSANGYITVCGMTDATHSDVLLRSGDVDAVVVFRHRGAKTETEIIVDASNPTNGQAASGYISGIINPQDKVVFITSTLYNPQMKSAYNFVPGIMGMIFILICAIMTSVSIVSEKETGTMDLLLVSPVHPRTIIIGKLIPYFLLSVLILAIMLTIAYTILGLPFSASVLSVVGVSLIYIVLALAIGLLVSTLVNTQVSALIVSAVLFMLPVIMLSGMIFPIDNMPRILQGISCIIPARWYIAAMRKLMIQQLEPVYVMEELLILCGMCTVILTLAIKKFKS